MKTQTKPETLENYLSLTYPITLYPEPDGGYTVMMTDLVGCIRKVILWMRLWLIFRRQK
jgi:antitoxin HicB